MPRGTMFCGYLLLCAVSCAAARGLEAFDIDKTRDSVPVDHPLRPEWHKHFFCGPGNHAPQDTARSAHCRCPRTEQEALDGANFVHRHLGKFAFQAGRAGLSSGLHCLEDLRMELTHEHAVANGWCHWCPSIFPPLSPFLLDRDRCDRCDRILPPHPPPSSYPHADCDRKS